MMSKPGYPVILFFTSSHCTPCKPIEIILNNINVSMFGKKLNIQKVDIETNRQLTEKYKITSLPTLIIGGEKLSVNIQEQEIIDAILNAFISSIEF